MSLLLVPPWMDWTFKAIGWGSLVIAIAAVVRFVAWLVG
jgi:hypothetical protein